MAALRNNYYDPQRPNYLNYGHLGPVISSELNKMLNASNFEEVELRKAIKERLKCFEGQGFVLNNSSEVVCVGGFFLVVVFIFFFFKRLTEVCWA